ncbi:MAG: hypothetical protein ACREIG_06380 [Nitrospiraceae bacterium]
MMPKLKIDLRLFEIDGEFTALGEYLEVLEHQLKFLKDQRTVQVQADLKVSGRDSDWTEVDIARQDLRYETEHVYPWAFRGSFVILLWALYETCVTEVAEFLQHRGRFELGLKDLRGDNFITRARKYFEHILRFPLHSDPTIWDRLDRLYLVRNAFAHAGGRLSMMNEKARRGVQNLIRDGHDLTEDIGDVLVGAHFARESYDLVSALARDLAKRAREWDDHRKAGGGAHVG